MIGLLKRNCMDLALIVLWIINLVLTTQYDTSVLFIICLIAAHIRAIVDNEIIAAYKHDREMIRNDFSK